MNTRQHDSDLSRSIESSNRRPIEVKVKTSIRAVCVEVFIAVVTCKKLNFNNAKVRSDFLITTKR